MAHYDDPMNDDLLLDVLPTICFLCHEPLPERGFNFWVGATTTIFFHVDCEERLGVKLALDAKRTEGDAA